MVARRIRDGGSTPRLLAWPKVVGAVGAGIDTGCRKVGSYSARLAEALTNAARRWANHRAHGNHRRSEAENSRRFVAGSRVLVAAPDEPLSQQAAPCDALRRCATLPWTMQSASKTSRSTTSESLKLVSFWRVRPLFPASAFSCQGRLKPHPTAPVENAPTPSLGSGHSPTGAGPRSLSRSR
jgi:hypothetical protein